MIFQEKKTNTGYNYHLEDVFGVVDIDTSSKLNAGVLDDVVVFLMRQNISAKVISGSVETPEHGVVAYRFEKADQWSDDDEEESCNDTPTSKEKQESEYIPMFPFLTKTLSWCKRFAAAFREAWRSMHS